MHLRVNANDTAAQRRRAPASASGTGLRDLHCHDYVSIVGTAHSGQATQLDVVDVSLSSICSDAVRGNAPTAFNGDVNGNPSGQCQNRVPICRRAAQTWVDEEVDDMEASGLLATLRTVGTTLSASMKITPKVLKGGPSHVLRTSLRVANTLRFPREHARLVEVLSDSRIAALTAVYPRLVFKYVRPYLARSFSARSRLNMLIAHYSLVRTNLASHFLRDVIDGKATIFEERHKQDLVSIDIRFPSPNDDEGDLCLSLNVNRAPVYQLAFSFIPGDAIGEAVDLALFVGRVQGVSGAGASMRIAQEFFAGIFPSRILVTAAEGVALSLNIQLIAGVSTEDQVIYEIHKKEMFFDYDRFWLSFDAIRYGGQYFCLQVPIPEKKIELYKSNHRSAAIRKRDCRHYLKQEVDRCMQRKYVVRSR